MIANAKDIATSIGMEDLLQHFGVKVNSRGRCACPIHGGKDENFSVKDGIGTCWSSCGGKSWNVVDFVIDYKGLTYPEAIEYIANVTKTPVEYTGAQRHEIVEAAAHERAKREELLLLNAAALDAYSARCQYAEGEGQEFDGRYFSADTLQAFRICITPPENYLVAKADNERWNLDSLKEVGLVGISKQNHPYDFFRNRILFPVHDHNGKVSGFSGRKRAGDDSPENPKYKNSPESLAYRKSQILYGLWQNRRHIRERGQALLVEGLADVATLHTYGINYAVGACGTALTKDQITLLKRYADEVVLLYDGDEAGLKAAERAVELCIEHGMKVKVALFPTPPADFQEKKYDPDNFIRKHKKEGFEAFLAECSQDGLIWTVMDKWDAKDIFKQEAAINLAGQLIGMVKSDMLKDSYIRELTKKNRMGDMKKALQEAIRRHEDSRLEKRSSLKPDQQQSVIHYGLYCNNNQYCVSNNPEEEGYAISNFVVNPIMLIVGQDRSRRLVEVINVHGHKFIRDIDSDSFSEMSQFRKEIERMGNYTFWEYAKPEHYIKIKRRLYDNMSACYPITTMGFRRQGFFAWANGLVVDGKFLPVDEYGLVQHEEVKYFLPAFSSINDVLMADDDDDKYEDLRSFVYVEGPCPSFTEWAAMMLEVHGANGMIGVMYYLAALYRDLVYRRFQFFPHLNLFGPPGSGKSFLAWSLRATFGKPKQPFHLVHGTNVAFFRTLAQTRNALAWFDEYSNDVNFKRVEALKAAYDGSGHEKGVLSNDNTTSRTKVNSGCIISGQQQLTQDIALFTRCIYLDFKSGTNNSDKKHAAETLKRIEATGILSQITSHLQQYRSHIDENFDHAFDENMSVIEQALTAYNYHIEDRMMKNYCILLTVATLIGEKVQFAWSMADFLEALMGRIVAQNAAISNQDDVTTWWKIISFFIETNELVHDEDFLVQEVTEVTVKTPAAYGAASDTHKITFEGGTQKVLFFRFTKAYRLYMEQLRREGQRMGLNEEAIKFYLKNSKAFIGEVKAKKFNGQAKACYAFNTSMLPFDLANIPLSIAVSRQEIAGSFSEPAEGDKTPF